MVRVISEEQRNNKNSVLIDLSIWGLCLFMQRTTWRHKMSSDFSLVRETFSAFFELFCLNILVRCSCSAKHLLVLWGRRGSELPLWVILFMTFFWINNNKKRCSLASAGLTEIEKKRREAVGREEREWWSLKNFCSLRVYWLSSPSLLGTNAIEY